MWNSVSKTWDRAYDRDAQFMIDQSLSRVLDVLTENGRVTLQDSKIDVTVTVERIDAAKVIERGDLRYRSDNLAEFLRKNPSYDLVPIVCAKTSSGYRVMDGHHRLRAYRLAGRDPLSIVIHARRGRGRLGF